MTGSAYASCAGVPVSITLCTKIQFGWRDGNGVWRVENRKRSCSTSKGKSMMVKTVTDHCVTGYYRTYFDGTLIAPPNFKPPTRVVAGASPWVRVTCF